MRALRIAFIVAAVAVARIFEEDGGRHLRPMEAQILFSSFEQSLAGFRTERSMQRDPESWERADSLSRGRSEDLRRIGRAGVSEEIALTPARSRRVDLVSEETRVVDGSNGRRRIR